MSSVNAAANDAIALDPDTGESDREAQLDGRAAYDEARLNGRRINWRYWAEQMPAWNAAQAARLMCSLDPDAFADLTARPGTADARRVAAVADRARSIERLADTEVKLLDSPAGWLNWAAERRFNVDWNVKRRVMQATSARAAVGELASRGLAEARVVPTQSVRKKGGRPPRQWRQCLNERHAELDEQHGGTASPEQAIAWLKEHSPDCEKKGGKRELYVKGRADPYDLLTVTNALNKARREYRKQIPKN